VFGKLFKKSPLREAGTRAQAQFHRCASSLANSEKHRARAWVRSMSVIAERPATENRDGFRRSGTRLIVPRRSDRWGLLLP